MVFIAFVPIQKFPLFLAQLRWISPAWQDRNHFKGADNLPPKLVAELPTAERNVTLVLQRNYQININVPVTVERYGRIIKQHINDTEEIGFYHDVKHGCSVMFQRSKGHRDFGQEFEFFGTIHVGTESYLIQPPDYKIDTHSLTEIKKPEITKAVKDYVHTGFDHPNAIDGLDLPKAVAKQTRIRRKRTPTVYEIEVLMVVDFSAYSFWKARLSGTRSTLRDTKAKSNLRQYYALLLHSADMYYRSVTGRGYEIKLLFAGLHISDKISASSWTEPLKNVSKTPVSINSLSALERFRNWTNSHENQLPGFDHAMLFTHYELHYYKLKNPIIRGYAYLGHLCDKNKVSIVQEVLDVYTPQTFAHELGHNLGANHDGEGNSCSDSDGYAMAFSSPYYIKKFCVITFLEIL